MEKALVLGLVAVDHFFLFSGRGERGLYVFSAFLLLALVWRAAPVVPLALLWLLLRLTRFFPSLYQLPSIPFLVPFFATVILLVPFREQRAQFSWVKKGTLDGVTWFWVATTSLLSALALILWGYWTDNLGLAIKMGQGFTVFSPPVVIGVVVPLFAIVNAFAEEVLYRGVMQEALERTLKSQPLVLFLQASAFAAIHYATGFPNGVVGYLMVLVYGVMLGYLRLRTRGMLAPYLTHVVADLVIGYFIYAKALGL